MSLPPGVIAVCTCPTCGGKLNPVTTSRAMAREMTIILRCADCGVEEGLHVRLVPVPVPESPDAKRMRANRARKKAKAAA